MIYGWRRSGL
ncbi:hypothetical protein LINGRAHAP2_LOCUS16819 [Linum grandiflorum]